MNYRDRLDIIADVLNVARQNPRKTQIMYGANLSYKVLQKYLAEVIDASLVSFDCARQFYTLTVKGERFLRTYEEYSKVNKVFEKHLNLVQAKRSKLEGLCAGNCH
jgi:predicted transcriptional regulator